VSEFRATYRLQLGPGFGFREARAVVPYLRDLGVSHLYLSPVLQARAGSMHGYDVVDPRRISDELGGEEELRRLCEAGLGVVLDIVPNHMAAAAENPFWADPELRTRFFDVDLESGWQRRFFTIDELAGLRVEDPEVFEETHAKVLELVEEGFVDGLRVDHPDGLADPRGYLERLRDAGVRHVWVEKILEPGEELRDWPVEGTVGYEFGNDSTALFVRPEAEAAFTQIYEGLTGRGDSWKAVAESARLEVARGDLRPEFEKLRSLLAVSGLEEAAAAMRVYRTYAEPWSGRVEDADREAVSHFPEELRRILLLEERGQGHDEFVVRWQQTTGPVMAKGVEDRAFYRFHRLVALNEVGADPSRWGLSVEEFHRACSQRAERFSNQLLATTTHDTKRSGDVRARIVALSWAPEEWRAAVLRFRELTGGGLDDPNEDYLLWQTLVGTWPIGVERLEEYMVKALREAAVNSSWVDPDERHEGRVKSFCRSLYGNADFLAAFEPFAERIAVGGEHVALGQTLLKLTAPGVPDIYQGDELWALSLVDPDNRRAVDWERRRRALSSLRGGALISRETAKLAVVSRVLELRAARPDAFRGEYEPVDAGPRVCRFRRGRDVEVVVPLDPGRPKEGPAGWRDVLPELPFGFYVKS
jgi:(1->4)-alpha-D-glucan 1-alpha-D-glucosylmutase